MPPRGSHSDFPAQVSPCSHPMSHPGLYPELGRTPSLTPGVSTSDRARSWRSPAGTLEGVHEVTTPTPGGDSSKTGLTCGGGWQQGLGPTGWTQDAAEGALRPAWDAVEGGMTAHSRRCVLVSFFKEDICSSLKETGFSPRPPLDELPCPHKGADRHEMCPPSPPSCG